MVARVFSLLSLSLLLGCQSSPKLESSVKSNANNPKTYVENRKHIKPIVYVTAGMPDKAKLDKVTGYCLVEYDLGVVKGMTRPVNVKITTCSVENYFEKACTRAIKKWIFAPLDKLVSEESTQGLISRCSFD